MDWVGPHDDIAPAHAIPQRRRPRRFAPWLRIACEEMWRGLPPAVAAIRYGMSEKMAHSMCSEYLWAVINRELGQHPHNWEQRRSELAKVEQEVEMRRKAWRAGSDRG
jgi:hypothetical protein